MVPASNQTEKTGILLIDKPKGITSFDVIRALRKKTGIRKMGHAGTLDPNATGLMIIAMEGATKTLTQFLKLPKTYEAEILFGVRTDTGDVEGRVVEEKTVEVSEQAVREALVGMVGTLDLPVPAYSAIKQGGVPLYKKARRGEVVNTPLKAMEVRNVEFLGMNGLSRALVRFDVGSGTYIRSLVEEMGKRLGVPATLANLRRTVIGDFKIEDAKELDSM